MENNAKWSVWAAIVVVVVAAISACSGSQSGGGGGSTVAGCASVALTGTAALDALDMNIPHAKTQEAQDQEDRATAAYKTAVEQANGQCADLEHAYVQVTNIRARIVGAGSSNNYKTEYAAARATWDRLAIGGGSTSSCVDVATTGTAALDAKEANDVAEEAATKALRVGVNAAYTTAKQVWDAARDKVTQTETAYQAAVLQVNGGCSELEDKYQQVLAARGRIFMAGDPDAAAPKAQYVAARAAWDTAAKAAS
jgi:hypothetical protein